MTYSEGYSPSVVQPSEISFKTLLSDDIFADLCSLIRDPFTSVFDAHVPTDRKISIFRRIFDYTKIHHTLSTLCFTRHAAFVTVVGVLINVNVSHPLFLYIKRVSRPKWNCKFTHYYSPSPICLMSIVYSNFGIEKRVFSLVETVAPTSNNLLLECKYLVQVLIP